MIHLLIMSCKVHLEVSGENTSSGDKDIYIANTRFEFQEKKNKKIASCLSAVDELITAQQDKIKQLKQHKKGLMQGLFLDPVEGCFQKLRIKRWHLRKK